MNLENIKTIIAGFTRLTPSVLFILFLFLCLCTNIAIADKQAEGADLDFVLENMRKAEKGMEVFTAEFKQSRHLSMMAAPLVSKGLIYFESSGNLLVNVIDPVQVTLLFKEGMLYIYDPELPEIEKKRSGTYEKVFRRLICAGQSAEELKKQYDIEFVPLAASSFRLQMVPRKKQIADYIDVIEVAVSSGQWLPEKIYFKEKKGDETSVELSYITVNKPLPTDIFSLDFKRFRPVLSDKGDKHE